jgi:hypothetical protein
LNSRRSWRKVGFWWLRVDKDTIIDGDNWVDSEESALRDEFPGNLRDGIRIVIWSGSKYNSCSKEDYEGYTSSAGVARNTRFEE